MKTFFIANIMYVAFIDKLKFPVAIWTESVRYDSPKDNIISPSAAWAGARLTYPLCVVPISECGLANCRPSVDHYYIKLSLGVPLTCSSAPHNKPEFSFLIVLFDTNIPTNTFNQERCSVAKLEVMTSKTVSNFHEKQSNSRTAGRLANPGIPRLTTRTNLQPTKIQATTPNPVLAKFFAR